MNKRVVWVVAFGLAVVLSACGTSSVNGEAARLIAGQVANYEGPAGMLEANVMTSGETPASVGTGSIDADGTFSFELDSAVPASALTPFDFGECSDIKVSNPNAQQLTFNGLSVVSEGRSGGELLLTDPDPELDSASRKESVWVYVSQDTKVQGTCDFSSVGNTFKQSANINLKSGWNVISADYSRDTTNNTEETSVYNGKASGVKWFYY